MQDSYKESSTHEKMDVKTAESSAKAPQTGGAEPVADQKSLGSKAPCACKRPVCNFPLRHDPKINDKKWKLFLQKIFAVVARTRKEGKQLQPREAGNCYCLGGKKKKKRKKKHEA